MQRGSTQRYGIGSARVTAMASLSVLGTSAKSKPAVRCDRVLIVVMNFLDLPLRSASASTESQHGSDKTVSLSPQRVDRIAMCTQGKSYQQ